MIVQPLWKQETLSRQLWTCYRLLMSLYGKTSHFRAGISDSLFYPLGDKERLTLENKNMSIKESRKKLVEILESLKNDMDSPIVQTHIKELRRLDPFIVEAYETVGKEVIEINNYSPKKIKEAMILKCYREKTTGVEFVQLLKNSFQVGKCYTLKYIKAELVRLYKMLEIADDQELIRQSLQIVLEMKEGIEVTATAKDGRDRPKMRLQHRLFVSSSKSKNANTKDKKALRLIESLI